MPGIHSDITSAFGDTPLVRLNALTEGLGGEVLAKLEFYNPGSSVKDRLGVALVDAAEESGELQPGGTIVESTSGNTGIALALIGAARGYKVILTMPASMSKERRTLLKAYGAELVLTDPYKGMTEAVATAERIVAETPGAVLARQFESAANAEIHRRTTAEEIWRDTDGRVDYFVAGSGTGGTITGVGQVLKQRNPDVQIVARRAQGLPRADRGTRGRAPDPGHRTELRARGPRPLGRRRDLRRRVRRRDPGGARSGDARGHPGRACRRARPSGRRCRSRRGPRPRASGSS